MAIINLNTFENSNEHTKFMQKLLFFILNILIEMFNNKKYFCNDDKYIFLFMCQLCHNKIDSFFFKECPKI